MAVIAVPGTATANPLAAFLFIKIQGACVALGEIVKQEVNTFVQVTGPVILEKVKEIVDSVKQKPAETRSYPKGMPDSMDGIDRDTSGSRGDRHAHGANDDWAINEDGTVHDGNNGRVPKDSSDFLRGKGFNIPKDRYPLTPKGEGEK